MESEPNDKAAHEIAHGKLIAESTTELMWGWGTPAGKLRAQRRGGTRPTSETRHILVPAL
ncbi:MAG: hypothetical protein P8046_10405 [Anaerolineales bacterium]